LTDAEGSFVDQAVVTYFAAPKSYTAEDVVEISCHGSPAILQIALKSAICFGARLAEPGEFTLRAYLNGRIDLPQAEAVRDLIEATTAEQVRIAARQLEGSVSRAVSPIKAQVVELIALLEAGIDFAEDDVDVAGAEEICRRISLAVAPLAELLDSFSYGKLIHDGFTISIVGKPNVGKSSLFNALLQRDRAIVTATPGTTRDTVSETMSLEGIPVRLVDTAGVRESVDPVERLGVQRTLAAIADADITLVVYDLSEPAGPEEEEILQRAKDSGLWLLVGNKADLPEVLNTTNIEIRISSRTGSGLEELRGCILKLVAPSGRPAAESALITSVRQELLLKESKTNLDRMEADARDGVHHEMLLLHAYEALRALDALTGATTADDILHHIFGKFCIGK
jgi:tRNA modification GTPase